MNGKFLAAGAAVLVCALSASANPIVVEFNESGLPSNTPLQGIGAFSGFGLSFGVNTLLAQDPRFVGAGIDQWGITNTIGQTDPIRVFFDVGALSVKIDWVTVSTLLIAEAYDAGGVLLDSIFIPAGGSLEQGSFTFSGIGTIARIEMYDNAQFLGIGRMEYTLIPLPSAALLGGLGLAPLALYRRRRAL